MTQRKTAFIKVDGIPEGFQQTTPVEPERRLPSSDIRIEFCDERDAEKIAEGLYTAYPEVSWANREPVHLRPPPAIRQSRLAQRLQPTLSIPTIKWIKAIHVPTGKMMGEACWVLPSHPSIHSHFRRSAIAHYSFASKMNWTDDQIDELWSGVDPEFWEKPVEHDDAFREEIMKGEKHWYLASMVVWHEFRGRGVAKRLMDWAIEQADEKGESMVLEAALTARAVYVHCGFVPEGKTCMVRWGKGRSVEENKKGEEIGNDKVEEVEKRK